MDDDTEATAQASRGANELIAASSEVVEEAGSSQSMSEEEGVSRGAEISSDTYLADRESSDDSVDCGEGDEPDFGFRSRRRRTLLERVQNNDLKPDELLRVVLASKAEVNVVDEKEPGFGPIHYIAQGKHVFKTKLLVILVIYGNADVDLTTTHKDQVTALHLAVEAKDLECVKTLIALGADINKKDGMGRTPLDFARWATKVKFHKNSVQMEQYENGQIMEVGKPMAADKGLTTTVELPTGFNFDAQSIPASKETSPDTTMIDALLSVGATTGSEVTREEDHIASLIAVKGTRFTSTSTAANEPMPLSTSTHTPWEGDYNRTNYCLRYNVLDSRISERLKDTSHSPTPEEALELVRDMKRREEFRRRYGSRILCLDGGGVRGLVTLYILREIERRIGKRITEIFDWIVGTSTGGIIALGLCYGPPDVGPKTTRQMRDLYWAKRSDVFDTTPLLLKKAEENAKVLESTLKEWLGEDVFMRKTFDHAGTSPSPIPRVLIPAVHKQSGLELHFFNDCFSDDFSGKHVWKVARSTSANFLYFTEFEGYIDGGILANNPAEEGLTVIQDHYRQKEEKLPISLLVSIGSGINPVKEIGSLNFQRLQAMNPLRWKNLIELLGSAASSMMNERVHGNCRSRCEEQSIDYFRFNPKLNNGVGSGEIKTDALQEMLWETRQYLHTEREKMDKLVELLRQSSLEIL